MTVDVVTVGEAMLRLSVPTGNHLETAPQLDVHVAGAEANTAIALAQLGRTVTWISRLAENPLGRRAVRELRASGVDTTHVRWDATRRMGLYFVELAEAPRPVSVVYDRASSAAAAMTIEDIPDVDGARIVHLTGITPALAETCREMTLELARRVRASPARLTVDVNYRAKLWSPEEARSCLLELAEGADLVVVTSEDARDVFGLAGEPHDTVRRFRETTGAGTVVLTLGERGSVWDSADGSGRAEAIPTRIVDRLGAGDAFVAGVIDGLLDDDLEAGVRTGTVLASLALGTSGDHVVTTRDEMRRMLEGHQRTIDR